MARSAFTLCFFLLGVFVSQSLGFDLTTEDVIFQLYTTNDRIQGKRLIIGNDASLAATEFNATLPTKIVVHGWTDDLNTHAVQLPKNAFLELEPMNVIGVDWSECSKVIMYDQSAGCAKQVGFFLADLISWLQQSAGLNPKDVHAVGHSLGAEAISFISSRHKIKRITACDPASPLYQYEKAENRIDPTDADFVDVIHTSTLFLGMKFPVGHADFYVNGGSDQPGCNDGLFGGCSHSASYHFFADSVSAASRLAYLGIECDSMEQARNQTCAGTPQFVMGYGASSEYRGIYSVQTDSVPGLRRSQKK